MNARTDTTDLGPAIAALSAGGAGEDRLALPSWRETDWRALLAIAGRRHVAAGEALIRRGEAERTLYIILAGRLEVMANPGDGVSLGRLARAGPGSVLGEQSFFDGAPRSAGAWAVSDADLATLTPEQFEAFAAAHPALARDLLFALGRVLAIRLRRTTAGLFD